MIAICLGISLGHGLPIHHGSRFLSRLFGFPIHGRSRFGSGFGTGSFRCLGGLFGLVVVVVVGLCQQGCWWNRIAGTSRFGFTIFPGGDSSGSSEAAKLLDQDHIVVGRVENLEIVAALNEVPVITSSKIGGAAATEQVAPNRSCTYGGGQLYCNEYKPLNKLSTLNAGIL